MNRSMMPTPFLTLAILATATLWSGLAHAQAPEPTEDQKASAASSATAAPAAGALPVASFADRWRWNARERTAVARAQLEAGQAEQAAVELETAARVAPQNLRALVNAGAGELLAGHPDRAMVPLAAAVERIRAREKKNAELDETRELGADAFYHLGTARLAAGDADGAIEALRDALRRDSADVDAKHNLELALREKERQEQEKQQQQQQQQKDQQQKQEQKPGQQDQQEQDPQSRTSRISSRIQRGTRIHSRARKISRNSKPPSRSPSRSRIRVRRSSRPNPT